MNLQHRGACGCEANTGDGAGILIQMPDRFLRKVAPGSRCRRAAQYGVGLVFLPRDAASARRRRAAVRARSSPRKASACSAGATCRPTTARSGRARSRVEPVFEQVFIGAARHWAPCALPANARDRSAPFERKLYVIRKRVEHAVDRADTSPTRRSSSTSSACRANTLIYKGMLTAEQIEPMFPDLTRPGRRVGARARAPALQHEHVPVVAARAPVSLHRAQRRDQHAARQHQLDARARRAAPVGRASATT